jgi:uncharacterized protein YdiU (UPF0061 family)
MKIPFDNRYVTLGDKFYVKNSPVAVSAPALIRFNEALANSLGFSAAELDESDAAAFFAGNKVLKRGGVNIYYSTQLLDKLNSLHLFLLYECV